MEIWGNTFKTNLQPIYIMQKQAKRIVNNVGFYHHTNKLFFKLRALKFTDLVELKTAQMIYKSRNNLLPGNTQKMFKERDGRDELRGEFN